MNNINYKSLSETELKDIKKNIDAILTDREERMTKAVKDRNLKELKSILKENIDHDLPTSNWKSLSFHKLNFDDLDFFLYVRKLPGYQIFDDESKDKIHKRSKTRDAIWSGLHDKKLFNYFINNPEFSPLVKETINESYLFLQYEIPTEVIHELFQRKMLSPTKDLFDKSLKEQCLNYLECFIKDNLLDISQDVFYQIYVNNWTKMGNDIFKLMDEKYPDYKNIKLSELMHKSYNGSNYHYQFPPQLLAKFKHFINCEDDLFCKIIETHKIEQYDIHSMLWALSDASPTQDEKFYKFVCLIADKYPNLVKEIKEYKSPFTQPFREIFSTVINNIEKIELNMMLNNELNENLTINNKKIKL